MSATKMQALEALQAIGQFIGRSQMAALRLLMRGEEKQYFFDKAVEMAELIAKMPKTYEQDSKGEDAVVSLHYFTGAANWYITEKDAGCDDDAPEEKSLQHQAFGLADLFQDGGELGYISIAELLENGAELDLHFKPRTLRMCRERQAALQGGMR